VAFFVHCTLIVYVGCSVGGGSVRPLAAAVAAAVLAGTPLAVLVWRERRSSTVGRPSRWFGRGLATVPVHAVGVGIASADLLTLAGMTTWSAVSLIAAVVSAVELLPVVLAGRVLRRPLSADLGEVDIEIRIKIRSWASWSPPWLAQNDVRLTDEHLVITVRPGPTWAYVKCIDLADVRAVEVRRTEEQDGPWFSTEGGHVLWPPPGDVVVIEYGPGVQILPVFEAVGFGEVLRARAERSERAGSDRS
jgi:hypothetical protein